MDKFDMIDFPKDKKDQELSTVRSPPSLIQKSIDACRKVYELSGTGPIYGIYHKIIN